MNANKENASIKKRFKGASALFLRGVVAPVTRPFIYVDRLTPTAEAGDISRMAYNVSAKSRICGDGIMVALGFGTGIVAGIIIFAASFVEAHLQLVRKGSPQNRPWLTRKLDW